MAAKKTIRTHAQDGVVYEVIITRHPKCLPLITIRVKNVDGKPTVGHAVVGKMYIDE